MFCVAVLVKKRTVFLRALFLGFSARKAEIYRTRRGIDQNKQDREGEKCREVFIISRKIENEKVKNIQYISSLNVRISHEVLGCADALIPYITENKQICHTLIISPPCCGKTTLIRDLIRQISEGNEYIKGCSVGVVDERSELGGCYLGIAQNHLGTRTDILDCCPKAEGMIMLIRSMAPRVIAVDEIGTSEDIHAIEYAMQCGCRLIASVHSLDMDEASKKPILGDLIRRRMFQRYVVLGQDHGPGKIREIYDERGRVLCRN